ncbi:MAG TPA: hypothetical protein VFX12_02995 [Vicinamibacterales bacterium]|nr:hypothetical protein [Vicinamibacterales bacterium]
MLDRLGSLLAYPVAPREDSRAALAACAQGDPRVRVHVAAFAGAADRMPLVELQELYTRTFDFASDAALYVGHQLFGEDGRRGLFMAGLVQRYRNLGLPTGCELTDHLSLVLRSLACDPDSDEARDLVRYAVRPALEKMLPHVERRAPVYGAVLKAVTLALEPSVPGTFGTACAATAMPKVPGT